MPDGVPIIRRIAWSEVCPWLIILRVFRLSISPPLLFLATVGVLLTPLGWKVAGAVFLHAQDADPEFAAEMIANASWPDRVGDYRPPSLSLRGYAAWFSERPHESLLACVPAVYLRFVDPFAQLARADLSVSQIAYYLFGGVWNLAIWSFLGGAVSRVAAVRLGREERLSLTKALAHARRCYGWYFAAPFFPMLGIVLLAAPIALLGLLMRTSGGVALAGLLWPFVLLVALLIAVLVVGLLFGWPLMWPTISSEESSDAFEAFSRSYSYTFQRPLQYLFFTTLTVLLGAVSWLFVSGFADVVVASAQWAAAWGAGSGHLEQVLTGDNSGAVWFGGSLISLAAAGVRTVVTGFSYSLFFCAATAVYLLLRREVDQTELDEVFTEDEEQRYGLPDLQTSREDGPEPETSQG